MSSNNSSTTSAGPSANADVDNLSSSMSQLMSDQDVTTSGVSDTEATDAEGVTGGSDDAVDSNDATTGAGTNNNAAGTNNAAVANTGASVNTGASANTGAAANTGATINNGTAANNGAAASTGTAANTGAPANTGAAANSVAAAINAPAPAANPVNLLTAPPVAIVPFLGVNHPFNINTPPSAFPDWASYITYCRLGPSVTLQFAVGFNAAGQQISATQMPFSKKLLMDFSDYFKAMFTDPMWKESDSELVEYDDISIEQFQRLYMLIHAGAPASRICLGRAEHSMRNLLDVYLLADRFRMPAVLDWANDCIADAMAVSTNWRAQYTSQVLNGPGGPAVTAFHEMKALDWANFYLDIKSLPGHLRPLRLCEILDWIIEYGPGDVFQNAWPNFHADFQSDLGLAYIRKYMATRV